MQLSYALRLPTDLRYVSIVRHLCVSTLTELGVVGQCVDDVALAVTEACANVVQHVGGDSGFDVRVEVDGPVCRIEVVDTGVTERGEDEAFALAVDRARGDLPSSSATPEDVLTHGRGLGLMRVLVDQMHFSPGADGTTVVLVKDLDLVQGSVLADATP